MSDMNIQHANANQDEQDTNEYLEFIKEHSTEITALALGAIVYAALTGGFGFLSEIPPIYLDAARYVVVSLLIVFIFGDMILDKIQEFNFHLLLELNLVTVDNPPRLIKLGEDAYNNMSVEGRLYRTPIIDVCIRYDKEDNHAKGVWLAELSDLEILRFSSSLKEAREKMQKEMLDGMAKSESAKTAAIMAQKELIETVVGTLADETTLEEAEINETIQNNIDEAKLRNIADEVADDEKETVDASEELIEDQLQNAQEMASLDEGDGVDRKPKPNDK